MRGDIVACLRQSIVTQPVRQRVQDPHRPLGPRGVPQADRIGHEQFEQRHRVGRRPFARRPRLVPADAARGREADQRHPAVEPHHRDRPWRAEPDPPFVPIGKRRLEPAERKPRIEIVEHAREQRRGQPPEPPDPGDETTVRPNEMLTATGHGTAYPSAETSWQAPTRAVHRCDSLARPLRPLGDGGGQP